MLAGSLRIYLESTDLEDCFLASVTGIDSSTALLLPVADDTNVN
jgi:hypothetical protein